MYWQQKKAKNKEEKSEEKRKSVCKAVKEIRSNWILSNFC